jgi:acyl-coenzyme A synthetase/AMP-(fatty) acid ligase
LYKTGDLVWYNSDGTLVFIGRKDGQVKIRVQRVELGDVEHHVYRCLADVANVVSEMITPHGSSSPMLVVFVRVVSTSDGSDEADLKAAPNGMIAGLSEKLADLLPTYMIPSACIPAYAAAIAAAYGSRRFVR